MFTIFTWCIQNPAIQRILDWIIVMLWIFRASNSNKAICSQPQFYEIETDELHSNEVTCVLSGNCAHSMQMMQSWKSSAKIHQTRYGVEASLTVRHKWSLNNWEMPWASLLTLRKSSKHPLHYKTNKQQHAKTRNYLRNNLAHNHHQT